jgi:SulP family sulfate permease
LLKADPNLESVIEESIDDPRYHIATDLLDAEV